MKWRVKTAYAQWIFKHDGVWPLLWEIGIYLIRPLKSLYEHLTWKRACRHAGSKAIEAHVAGHALTLNGADKGISRELAVYGVHEPLATQLFCQSVRPGMTLIDIGSNIGYYALFACRCVGGHGTVCAIEPHPDNFRLLQHNVDRNGYTPRVRFYQAAIADRSGVQQLYLSSQYNLHSLTPSRFSTDQRLDVAAYTLDALVERESLSVEMVRMDIEGYEVQAIHGMRRTLERFHPALFIELHPYIAGGRAIVQLLRHLQAHGYGLDAALDRVRDQPWHARVVRRESKTLEELCHDRRIVDELSCLTVLLSWTTD